MGYVNTSIIIVVVVGGVGNGGGAVCECVVYYLRVDCRILCRVT